MALAFPDVEQVLVAYLKDNLDGTYVSVKKATPDTDPAPERQVVIAVGYNAEKDRVLRNASLTVDCYALGYIEANDLALAVEYLLRQATVGPIKAVDVRVGPVRVSDESQYEKRSIDAGLVVKGYEL